MGPGELAKWLASDELTMEVRADARAQHQAEIDAAIRQFPRRAHGFNR